MAKPARRIAIPEDVLAALAANAVEVMELDPLLGWADVRRG
jgi:hypothetical protein